MTDKLPQKFQEKFQEKLDSLETLLAHQSIEINDLNEVVTAQANEIDALKKYVKLKLDKIENTLQAQDTHEMQSVSEEAAANKPPHY